jgi:hypothetical protein
MLVGVLLKMKKEKKIHEIKMKRILNNSQIKPFIPYTREKKIGN